MKFRMMTLMLLVVLVVMMVAVVVTVAQDGPTPLQVIELVLADLTERVGADEPLTTSSLSFATWSWSEELFPDTSLGCPQPDVVYAQIITRGFQIEFTYFDTAFDYRATPDGDLIILCDVYEVLEATAEATGESTAEATEPAFTGTIVPLVIAPTEEVMAATEEPAG
jgi:hypothetical protein